MKLYEIEEEIRKAIEAGIDHETGEIIDENSIKILDTLQMGREQKLLSLACVIKGLDYEEAALSTEIKKLQKRKSSVVKHNAWVKNYLRSSINTGDTLSNARVTISWLKSKSVAVSVPVETLPIEYQNITIEAKKKELKVALDSGKTIEGVKIVENNNLQIN